MNIFLIIIGAILFLIGGWLFLGTCLVTKNQKQWDDFYKVIEENNPAIPEEEVYKLTQKIKFWSGFAAFFGFLVIAGGILLTIF